MALFLLSKGYDTFWYDAKDYHNYNMMQVFIVLYNFLLSSSLHEQLLIIFLSIKLDEFVLFFHSLLCYIQTYLELISAPWLSSSLMIFTYPPEAARLSGV